MNELALFAGAGGGLLASRLLDWRTVCAVEIDPYCQRVLLQRQRDGYLDKFPIWDDVRTFDGTEWRGRIDVVTGGFPCQDISIAGRTRAGLDGERSGLWFQFARVISEIRPRFVLVENSPMLIVRGIDRILGGLASLGYDAEWGVFSACSMGAPHTRERVFIVAHANEQRRRSWRNNVSDSQRQSHWQATQDKSQWQDVEQWIRSLVSDGNWLSAAARIQRMADGVANRLDRLRAIGNGQVPAVVVRAWDELTNANH